jgi:hypothetical protein
MTSSSQHKATDTVIPDLRDIPWIASPGSARHPRALHRPVPGAASLTPICSSCTGAVVHLYAGVGPGAVIALTLVVAVLTSLATAMPYLPSLIGERSQARVRDAVLAKIISPADAAVTNGDVNYAPDHAAAQIEQQPTKAQPRSTRHRRGHG